VKITLRHDISKDLSCSDDARFGKTNSYCNHKSCLNRDVSIIVPLLNWKTRAVLSQGGPRDAAENFGTYRSLKRHCAVSLPQQGFLVQACFSDRSNAEITQSTLIFTAS